MRRWTIGLCMMGVGVVLADQEKHASYKEDFKAYDLDGNGLIDPQEIRTVYGNSGDLTESDFYAFWAAVDLKHRGYFTLEDFVNYAIKQDKQE